MQDLTEKTVPARVSPAHGRSAKPLPARKEEVGAPSSLLEKMRANPKGDWRISDVAKMCSDVGLTCAPPSRGSHYKISSQYVKNGLQTVPAKRPIKACYIRSLVGLADTHMKARAQEKNQWLT